MKKLTERSLISPNSGITLIALVITIIVLLILAGVSLNLISGSDGILNKATNATSKNKKVAVEERFNLILSEWKMEKYISSKTFNDFLEEKTSSKEIDGYETIENEKIEISKDGYVITVDVDGNIVEEIYKSGPKPLISNIRITLEDGTEPENYSQEIGTPLTIDFDAEMKDGEITKVEPERPYTTNGTEEIVNFKVTGTVNGEEYSKDIKVLLASKYKKPYESLQKAIEQMTEDGNREIQIAGQGEMVSHGINAIVYNEDLVLTGTTSVRGANLIPEEKTYEFGDSSNDVATENEEAQNTVVLKVNGNLTIDEGVKLTACKSENGYGGPKGLVIYCTGTLTNNGEISMTARGARAEGQNIYLYKNRNGIYEKVAKDGEDGGKEVTYTEPGTEYSIMQGEKGKDGTERSTGGGGSGSAYSHNTYSHRYTAISGAGAKGTSYSGGAGSGSVSAVWEDVGFSSIEKNATMNGGNALGSYALSYSAGGGAGNPGGIGYGDNIEIKNGTGGLLVIYCKELYNHSKISSNGSPGAIAVNSTAFSVDGGCSGGGSINIFTTSKTEYSGTIEANGGKNNNGGAGGNGTINIGYIIDGNYVSER